MLDYLEHMEARKMARASLRWQRNVMAAKALMFVFIGVGVLVLALKL